MNTRYIPSELQQPSKSWISWMTRRLSIHQKIGCGYALALGIAVLGTTTGFLIGDRYQNQARQQEKDALEEVRHLHRLEINLLLAQSHQQHLSSSVEKPEHWQEDYFHFFHHIAEASKAWSEFKSSYQNVGHAQVEELPAELEAFQRLVQNYDDFLEGYFQRTETLLNQINSPNLQPEEIDAVQKQLSNFNNSNWNLKLENFTDDLNQLIDLVNQEYEQARVRGIAANEIRVKVIAVSILLSVAIAIILAIYTSRAIARPIQATTRVAQQVTQQENFDLQAPVTTQDEVGALTTALNQLIQRVNQLLEAQKAANQAQLIQSEKMSSLGRMMAGVAHEINNPVNFIYGNSIHASEYVEELLALLETYVREIPHPPLAVQEKLEEIEFDFIKQDLPKLLESMKVGAERAVQIVLSLKDFSRLDEEKAHFVDLHACIDSTLLILNNRIKNQIVVKRNYGDIPQIKGYAGLLYQVFMNLLSNAIDALEESRGDKFIEITTKCIDDGWVVAEIADNGSGISPEAQAKIFEPFFTTKPRGVGTGLGLAISHQIIVEKHSGKFTYQSKVGVGTEFAIALPIKPEYPVSPLTKTGG